ncbi:30S ribosomal protein S9 [Candidatus Woesearchaeota archaeon]|nr:30S ribosomal protein S9 [Candidatus Woesearchaeota archaeon]
MKAINTSGKRKRALAKATLESGKGIIRINSQLLQNYKPDLLRERINEVLMLAGDDVSKVNIYVKVSGGGIQGQNDAIRLAIARAFVKYDKKLKEKFVKYDRRLIVADIRVKEMYKPNDSKARSKRQKSYR